jgi:predicted nucleic acid-binding protein
VHDAFPLLKRLRKKTIELRTQSSITLPDAVIAASELSLDATILTRNAKDFYSG